MAIKLFGSEGEAQEFLERKITSPNNQEQLDEEILKERLFDIPETLSPGHYEFSGKNGYVVSFDLTDFNSGFDECYLIWQDHIKDIQGEWKPIFKIKNLSLKSNHFPQDSQPIAGMDLDITWVPNLRNSKSGGNCSFIKSRKIYLLGETGFLSNPKDLLSFFHEVGHIQSRTPEEYYNEKASVKRSISASGSKIEINKEDAYMLKRERDANAWMLRHTKTLFKDLEMPPRLIQHWVNNLQLGSYNKEISKRLEEEKDSR